MLPRIEIPEPVGSLIDLMMVALRTTDPEQKVEISKKLEGFPFNPLSS